MVFLTDVWSAIVVTIISEAYFMEDLGFLDWLHYVDDCGIVASVVHGV
jgi:hypothetical protein